MSDKTQNDWGKRFEDIKPVADVEIRNGEWLISQNESKNFISQELERQHKEDMERVLEMINNDYNGRDITIYEIRDILQNEISKQT